MIALSRTRGLSAGNGQILLTNNLNAARRLACTLPSRSLGQSRKHRIPIYPDQDTHSYAAKEV